MRCGGVGESTIRLNTLKFCWSLRTQSAARAIACLCQDWRWRPAPGCAGALMQCSSYPESVETVTAGTLARADGSSRVYLAATVGLGEFSAGTFVCGSCRSERGECGCHTGSIAAPGCWGSPRQAVQGSEHGCLAADGSTDRGSIGRPRCGCGHAEIRSRLCQAMQDGDLPLAAGAEAGTSRPQRCGSIAPQPRTSSTRRTFCSRTAM